MRGFLHLFLMIAVFCCGLHLAEPVQAHDEDAHYLIEQSADYDGAGEDGVAATHALHHHCPIALDPNLAPAQQSRLTPALLFAGTAACLTSLSQAPPLQPPAA